MAKIRKTVLSVLMATAAVGILASSGSAQAPDLRVTLGFGGSRATDRLFYIVGDPIPITLTLENREAGTAYTSRNFSGLPYHLMITFTSPEGKGITAPSLGSVEPEKTHVPPPRIVLVGEEYRQVEEVEGLPGTDPGPPWGLEVGAPDANSHYSLSLPGRYLARATIPMRTYLPPFIVDPLTSAAFKEIGSPHWMGALESNTVTLFLTADFDGDGFHSPYGWSESAGTSAPADCDDTEPLIQPGAVEVLGNGRDDDCDPATPDIVAGSGTILVVTEKHTVGTGSQPGSIKAPIPNLPLRVYSKASQSCAAGIGVSWQNYRNIWNACSGWVQGGATGDSGPDAGVARLNVGPGDYLVIGLFDPDRGQTGDEIYLGNSAGDVREGETVRKYLQVIEKSDGKKVPAKYTIFTGSELMVIEPEYVEWTGAQELYPFVFQSVGDWNVTTTIFPPEGFVADQPALSTDVNFSLEALQFLVTDVGSDWVATKVEHKIKHKGKTQVLKSKIGVKKAK